MAKKGEKNPDAGRLTLYRPKYCEEVIKLAHKHDNLFAIAVEWGVAYQTVQSWSKQHSKFGEAYKVAKTILADKMVAYMLDGLNPKSVSLMLNQLSDVREKPNMKAGLLEGETLAQRATCLLRKANEGEAAEDTVHKTMSTIAMAAKIEEVEELRSALADWEKKAGVKK